MKIKNFKEFGSLSTPCLIFVGPPGCGKGTQAEIVCKKTGMKHVSTGDILRQSEDDEVKELLKTGKLLPDDLVSKELEKFIQKNKKSKGFVFDGYPRNLKQKTLLDKIMSNNNLETVNIFFLNVPEETLKERIKERGKTSGRADDKDPEVFKVRMEEYRDQTLPMIKSMKKLNRFLEISGEKDLDEITEIIFDNLGEI
jgi:adenylate kinase